MNKMVNLSNIRAEMAKKRISGINLAKELKLSQRSIYLKLNGQREFTANEIGIIAKILDVELEKLFFL